MLAYEVQIEARVHITSQNVNDIMLDISVQEDTSLGK